MSSQRLYRIGTVAEMSGLSIDVLRAWERRHSLLRPTRTEGGFRLYGQEDVEVLKEVRRLIAEGMSIGQVAQLVPGIRKRLLSSGAAETATPMVDHWRERALAAVEALDPDGVEAVFDEALASLPPLRVLDELLIPLEREIGDRWEHGRATIGQEHLLSTSVRSRLLVLVHGAPRGQGEKALLACFPEEEHDLGVWAAALRLRHRGWRVAVLGARTPVKELVAAVKGYRPRFVGLSAIADPGEGVIGAVVGPVLEALPRGAVLLVGGAGAEHRAGEVKAAGARLAHPGWESDGFAGPEKPRRKQGEA